MKLQNSLHSSTFSGIEFRCLFYNTICESLALHPAQGNIARFLPISILIVAADGKALNCSADFTLSSVSPGQHRGACGRAQQRSSGTPFAASPFARPSQRKIPRASSNAALTAVHTCLPELPQATAGCWTAAACELQASRPLGGPADVMDG